MFGCKGLSHEVPQPSSAMSMFPILICPNYHAIVGYFSSIRLAQKLMIASSIAFWLALVSHRGHIPRQSLHTSASPVTICAPSHQVI